MSDTAAHRVEPRTAVAHPRRLTGATLGPAFWPAVAVEARRWPRRHVWDDTGEPAPP